MGYCTYPILGVGALIRGLWDTPIWTGIWPILVGVQWYFAYLQGPGFSPILGLPLDLGYLGYILGYPVFSLYGPI